MASLGDFKGLYKGSILLMGSGPSLGKLNGEEREALGKAFTFAGARFFKWGGLTPCFYILTEQEQAAEWRQRGFDRASASIAKFWVAWQPAPEGWVSIPPPPSLSYHHYTLPDSRLSSFEGECQHMHMGHDCPIAMLQVARYMGFSRFFLLGVDQTEVGYAWDSQERRKVGSRFDTMASLYTKARAEVGGELYDSTPGGMLNERGVLPFVPLEEALA